MRKIACLALTVLVIGTVLVFAAPPVKFQTTEAGMSSTGLKVYYAHNEVFFGTEEESNDLETLGKFGMNVVDPSWPSIRGIVEQMRVDGASEEQISEFLLRYVDSCDAVVFRKMDDGTISKDVKQAIERARSSGKPVLQIPVFPEETVE